ncbi:MAG: MFS transporter [Armatimonadetes bacterium]|jgi:OPA family glycerol-3-phosphate transporter-like MFS transporter/OPA family sugar phosphate sensor protein UhpC-like MFS transporter|nr:MFS transporter [Armatimonadota bacterium]
MMFDPLINIFRPAKPIPSVKDPVEVDRLYRYWRTRIMYSTLIGYALFYFVRTNLAFAIPGIESELGITKASLGLFLTLHGLLYGVSKFVNGMLGDRANLRYFMVAGLILSAIMNIGFGLSSLSILFGIFWLFNGWFQGMGFPPCARALTHWFSPNERGVKFSIWNTSHSVGAMLVALLCAWLATYNWRLVLLVPAGLAIAGSIFLLNRLRDTPQSLGLPAVEVYKNEGETPEESAVEKDPSFRKFVISNVFCNPMIWVISIANFFLYTVRYSILNWLPTFLKEARAVDIKHTGFFVFGVEFAGVAGMLAFGWMADRIFRGRAARACFFSMLFCAVCMMAFWKLQSHSMLVNAALLCGVGLFVYGPQALVGVIAANLATRRAAATAIGVTGFFGYASGIISGWGVGSLVKTNNWDPVFAMLTGCAGIAALLFAIAWNAYRGKATP